MTSGGDRVRIKQPCLLLVEGKDEVSLLARLNRHCLGDSAAGLQVVEAGGHTKFRARIDAILRSSETNNVKLRALGIVRDADEDGEAAWASVRDAVSRAGLEPPDSHGEFSDGPPDVGILILPDIHRRGAIETLCVQSVEKTPAGRCAEQYLACLEESEVLESRNRDKSFVHAWLAGGRDPVVRVGEGARQGRWDFDHAAFAPLAQFVRHLAERAAARPPSMG